eukprot:TRINITY_DN6069_c0_g1_i1.p1 TRINITY_DN6069_c0_g1~~TRINITY_DN6069_c0_g1_i1.p1  ORF type:complete len:488 (+),score=119.27 TRINITY_DN6069_c0_g1_i1:29-1492(+)
MDQPLLFCLDKLEACIRCCCPTAKINKRLLFQSVFLFAVFSIYGSICFYIIWRLAFFMASDNNDVGKSITIAVGCTFSALFIVGRALENFVILGCITSTLVWIGGLWIVFFIYLFLLFALIDIIRLIDRATPFLSHLSVGDDLIDRRVVGTAVLGLTLLLLIIGLIQARRVKVVPLQLTIDKPLAQPVSIVVASDFHTGALFGRDRVQTIVSSINALHPDIILLIGDILDEMVPAVVRLNEGAPLAELKARLGVFAVNGNHEHFGDVEIADQYLSRLGIRVLRDECHRVADSIYLIGREDRVVKRFSGADRAPLRTLVEQIPALERSRCVLINMDHQPNDLFESSDLSLDVHLSAHTHAGQLFPFNILTRLLYEIHHGYLFKNQKTHVYVTSGVGTWGSPTRILVARPEIVHITLSSSAAVSVSSTPTTSTATRITAFNFPLVDSANTTSFALPPSSSSSNSLSLSSSSAIDRDQKPDYGTMSKQES